MNNLEANLRTEISKGSNNILRKQGMVPCILYGGDEKNELISISKKNLKVLLDQENFLSNVLKIKIQNKEINVLPREVSFDVYLRASEKPVLRILKNFRPNYFNEKYLIKVLYFYKAVWNSSISDIRGLDIPVVWKLVYLYI